MRKKILLLTVLALCAITAMRVAITTLSVSNAGLITWKSGAVDSLGIICGGGLVGPDWGDPNDGDWP